jgi:hypothetical protein
MPFEPAFRVLELPPRIRAHALLDVGDRRVGLPSKAVRDEPGFSGKLEGCDVAALWKDFRDHRKSISKADAQQGRASHSWPSLSLTEAPKLRRWFLEMAIQNLDRGRRSNEFKSLTGDD